MWQPIETAPKDGTIVLLAGEFDYPGDWRIKMGFWAADDDDWRLCWASWPPTHWMPLPEAPDAQAQPAPSVPEGWLRAIDEALVATHLGVADAADNYEDAKRKLNELLGWHVAVATDPAVNGGFKLVPIEPTFEMLDKGSDQSDGYVSIAQEVWAAMIAAAPEVKP